MLTDVNDLLPLRRNCVTEIAFGWAVTTRCQLNFTAPRRCHAVSDARDGWTNSGEPVDRRVGAEGQRTARACFAELLRSSGPHRYARRVVGHALRYRGQAAAACPDRSNADTATCTECAFDRYPPLPPLDRDRRHCDRRCILRYCLFLPRADYAANV